MWFDNLQPRRDHHRRDVTFHDALVLMLSVEADGGRHKLRAETQPRNV